MNMCACAHVMSDILGVNSGISRVDQCRMKVMRVGCRAENACVQCLCPWQSEDVAQEMFGQEMDEAAFFEGCARVLHCIEGEARVAPQRAMGLKALFVDLAQGRHGSERVVRLEEVLERLELARSNLRKSSQCRVSRPGGE